MWVCESNPVVYMFVPGIWEGVPISLHNHDFSTRVPWALEPLAIIDHRSEA